MTKLVPNRSSLRPRPLAIMATCLLAAPPLSASDIRSLTNAPGSKQPVVRASANGTPVVDITAPGADGVSHNLYGRLDVDHAGAVFNNARRATGTELAGRIAANPALVGGTAKTILNEIRAASPSELAGYLEIGGDRADLVIANPAGITCSGCGFINAERAMLTTGQPRFEGGRWTGMDVRGGRIRIQDDGLDASRTAEADLLARAIEINAGIWAKRLDVVAGTGRFNREAGFMAPVTTDAGIPEWGIDTSRLGGMYADKIRLIANEHGVGVRNHGTIASGAKGLSLTADGRLLNRGETTSRGEMRLQAGRIDSAGDILAERHLTLRSDNHIDNCGGLIAGQTDVSLTAPVIDNGEGHILAGDSLALNAGSHVDNDSGRLFGARDLSLLTDSMSGDGEWLSDEAIDITVTADYAHRGEMSAEDRVSLTVMGALDNAGRLASGGEADIEAREISNHVGGEIAADILAISSGSRLGNQGLIDGQEVSIEGAVIDNAPNARLYGSSLSVTARQLRNRGDDSAAATLAARRHLQLTVDLVENRDEALIFSGGDMTISGPNGDAADHVLNAGATIEALDDISIDAERIDNHNGGLATTQVDEPAEEESWIQPRGSQATYDTATCSNLYAEDVTCQGRSHGFEDYTWFQVTAVTSHTEVTTTAPATLRAGKDMTIDGGKLSNHDSQIVAGETLQARVQTLDNQATQGQDITRREGTARFTTVEACGFMGSDHCREWHGTSPYRPAPEYGTPYDLPTLTYTGQGGGNPSTPALPGRPTVSPSTSVSLPNASLFRIRADNPNAPLVETAPRFAGYRQWYGSQAMLDALARDPAYTQKRLGDGFYEQSLVRQQVVEQTGQRRLDGFTDDETQFRALVDAGVALGRDLGIVPGVRLSAAQLDRLTSDIVWLEESTVTIDGETQRALVPTLHLANNNAGRGSSHGLIAAQAVNLAVDGTAVNRGRLRAGETLSLAAERIESVGGALRGDCVDLAASRDIDQRGGEIVADSALSIRAGRDITVEANTRHDERGSGPSRFTRDQIVAPGRLAVAGSRAELDVSAGRDLTLQAAEVAHDGNGTATLSAGRDLRLTTTAEGENERIVWDANNHLVQGQSGERGSHIDTRGNLHVNAGRDLSARAAVIDSAAGEVTLTSGENIKLEAGRSTRHWEEAHRIEDSGFLSSSVTSTLDASRSDRVTGTQVGGQQVSFKAGNDITIQGSQVISDRGTTALADGNITLLAEHEDDSRHHFQETKRSGLFSNGGLSVTYGSHRLASSNDVTRQTNIPTQLASIGGDVSIKAGDTYRQSGSALLAPAGDIDIHAGRVEITESRQTGSTSQMREMEQSGLTLALTSPVIEAAKSIQHIARAADDTDSGRMKRLAAASAGLAGVDAYSHIKTGRAKESANLADKAGGVSINISVGASESHYRAESHSDNARGSSITAGGDVWINATGQSERSDIVVRGSDIRAEGDASLSAEDEIALLAAESRREEKSENDSQSASVGIGIDLGGNGVGFSITASAARGEGESEASELTHQLSHVSAGKTTSLKSGDDTALVGAVVTGQRVQADVGGDLRIESIQDELEYRAEQHNESVGVSIPIAGASFSASFSKEDSEAEGSYRSVTEQSAIHAGEGGFDLTVAGNTDLIGGVISSNADPADNRLITGTLTSSDLTNAASANAEAIGISLSSDMVTQGKYGAAKGLVANTALDADRAGESHGRTRSAIQAGGIIVTDARKQAASTGSSAGQTIAELSRDTSNSHVAAVQQTPEEMRLAVEADRVIKKAIHAEAVKFTDESYRTMFLREHPMFLVLRDEEGKPLKDPETGKPALRKLSEEEKRDLKAGPNGKVAVFTNGIFNDQEAATGYSAQMSEVQADQPIYLIHFPMADNAVSELLVAGYQKFMENDFWGLANATKETRNAMAQFGNDGLYLSGHSRGAMTIGNAATSLSRDDSLEEKLTDTRFRLLGPAYNAKQLATQVDNMNGDAPTRVELQNHADDFVGSIIGGNEATYNKRPEDSSRQNEWLRMFDEAPTVHSCYGNGAADPKGCFDNYGKPTTIQVRPTQ